MEKVDKCPKCKAKNPVVTFWLYFPESYENSGDIPDFRVYALICLECGATIDEFQVDNRLSAVKMLRDEMDRLYGKSEVLPLELFVTKEVRNARK